MTTWSTTETTIEWVSQDDASITFQVVKQNGGTGGGGVTDHGALTGLADDDHKQYQRAKSVYTTTSPFTITDESLVVTTGSAVTLPDSTAQTGRMVSIGAASVVVTISAAGSDTIHGVGATFTLPVGNGVTFVALSINGTTGWSIINRRGSATDLPEWYSQGIADGNLVTLQAGVPAWTTGTRTQYDFLSGTGWTYDVPVLVPVKNTTASTIAKGAPVYATGTVGATSTIEIAPADANVVSAMPAIGLTESSLAANATGFVTVVGTLRGLNTNAYSINQPLYVSTTAGQLTGTKPTGTSDAIQMIALVTRVNSSNGEVLVLAQGSDEVPNAIDAGKITSGTLSNDRLDTELQALASTTSAADALPYFTGSGTATTTTLTSAGRALIDDANAAAQRTTLGLATIASSASASDLTTGTVALARLSTQAAPTSTPFTTNDWVPLWTGWGTGAANIGTGGTAAASNSTARYQPVWIGQSVSITGLGIDVAAANAGASAVVRLGIHANSSGRPGDVVVDAGTASLNTAVAKELTFSSVSLSPGWYWIVIATQSLDTAGTNPTFRAITSGTSLTPRTAVPSATASQDAVLTATVSGALANGPTVSTSTTNVQAFKIWGRFG